MGCVASAEEDRPQKVVVSLAERKAQAKTNRKEAKSIVHNLVNEEFGRDIREFYDVDEGVLGEGIQGVVRTVVHKQTGCKYAMKTVPLGSGKDSRAMAQLHSEVDLIRRLDHPNIVRLQEVFETEESLFLVMDLCTGGDMMTRWERNRRLRYSEDEAALTVKKIVNAVRYCHERHVVHRDIKLENLLWEHPDDDAEPQLVDFGLGVTFSDETDVFREDVGSLYYVAPEVLARNYTKACDCWSIGVIAYMLLAGMPPFMAPSDEGVKLKIKWAKVNFHKDQWENVSEEAKDFIKRMLMKAPAKRMTAEEASAHPWLSRLRNTPEASSPSSTAAAAATTAEAAAATETATEAGTATIEAPLEQKMADRDGEGGGSGGNGSTPLDPALVHRLKKFAEFGKLKRVALGVIAHSLNPEEIRTLRREFQRVDVEGRGEISPMDLQNALNASGSYSAEEVSLMFDHMDVDHDGKIGFNEFLAASLHERHMKDENLRMAFNRLDYDDAGVVTMDNLKEITGATVDDQSLEGQITDDELRSALLGSSGEGSGVSYEIFQRAMKKSFSSANLDNPRMFSSLVRAASKLSIAELAMVTGGSETDADAIIKASHLILSSSNLDVSTAGDKQSTSDNVADENGAAGGVSAEEQAGEGGVLEGAHGDTNGHSSAASPNSDDGAPQF